MLADEIAALRPKLLQYAQSLVRDQTAEDLAQDALLRCLEQQHLFQPGTDLRAWCSTVLHNLYATYVGRRLREARFTEHPTTNLSKRASPMRSRHPGAWWARPTADPEAHVLAREVVDSLGRLSKEMRDVVVLGADRASYIEMARVLGIPEGTVRSRLARGREKMRVMAA